MALIDKASLLMVPSVYEDGTLYNVLPSGNKAPDETGNHNGYDQTRADFTFSRGFNLAATRVNASGLIEKGRENLLLQSNNFASTNWVKASGCSFVSKNATDPFGVANNAWTMSYDGTFNGRFEQLFTSTAGNVYTSSIYARATSGTPTIKIGDSSGTKSIILSTTWQRVEHYQVANDTTFYLKFQCDTAETIEFYGAQLEAGLVATDYIETGATTATAGVLENTPRIDYSSGAGALLLESQRTNLIEQSEYYNTYWSTTSNLSIADNYATSPEGYKNASRWVSTGGSFPQMTRSISGLTIGTTYTASFYVKSDGTNQIQQTIWFTGFDGTTFTPGNDWTRITNTFTATATSHTFVLFTNSGAAAASSFLLYGIQLESGSHVSSYVPTYGSAATRGADSCSVTGASDVIGQTEGTIFIEFDHRYMHSYPNEYIIDVENGTNKIWIRKESAGNTLTSRLIVGGTNIWTIAISATDGAAKIALAYKSGDNAVYYNGSQVGTSSATFSGNSFSDVYFSLAGSSNPELNAKNLTLFNERLSNTELATLTTL